jgi:hypothetical protein
MATVAKVTKSKAEAAKTAKLEAKMKKRKRGQTPPRWQMMSKRKMRR